MEGHTANGRSHLELHCPLQKPSVTWLFKFKLIPMKQNLKFSSSVVLATPQALSSHVWAVQIQSEEGTRLLQAQEEG